MRVQWGQTAEGFKVQADKFHLYVVVLMKSDSDKLLKRHDKLVHSELLKVVSHVQREEGEWIINTLMIEGCEVPFRFKRKKAYRNLQGQRVNLTYYPDSETVAGFEMEVMNVVRIKVS